MAALRDEWQSAKTQRQQEIVQRRSTVQSHLQQLQQLREQNRQTTRHQLATHHAAVQSATAAHIAELTEQRGVQAQQTAAMLQAFDAQLRDAVSAMRADNQKILADIVVAVADLQQETYEMLAHYEHDRAVMRPQQVQALAEYVTALQGTVADYLAEISEIRQANAVVDEAQRHRDRAALTTAVQAMRQEFGRQYEAIRTFRETLRQSVWGDAVPVATITPVKSSLATIRPQAEAAKKRRPVSKRRARAKSAGLQKMAATNRQAAPSAIVSRPIAKTNIPIEEAVFDYLQSCQSGARLTEIESSLGINRFQAVDALRSLMQKDLILQQDRTYRIQEEALL